MRMMFQGCLSLLAPSIRTVSRPPVASLTARRFVSKSLPLFSKVQLFDGEIAELYSELTDSHLHPNGPWLAMNRLLENYVSSGQVLDLASGPGEPGTLMARSNPSSQFLLTDISPDMVEQAKRRAQGVPNVQHEIADAEDLPYSDSSFDAIVCCYGLMFPDDKPKAFAEIARTLKPRGVLITAYWKDIPGMAISKRIMETVLGGPAPPPPINPLSLAEEGLFEELVKGANLDMLSMQEQTYPIELGFDPDRAFQKVLIPLMDFLNKQVEEEGNKDAFDIARNVFDEEFEARQWRDNGQFVMPDNTFKLAVAKKE